MWLAFAVKSLFCSLNNAGVSLESGRKYLRRVALHDKPHSRDIKQLFEECKLFNGDGAGLAGRPPLLIAVRLWQDISLSKSIHNIL